MAVAIKSIPMFSELVERGRGDINQFAKDFLRFPPPIDELHDGQKKWVSTAPWCPERMIGCGNRWGKSSIAGVKGLHHAFYQTRHPRYAELKHEYIVVDLSITLDMAQIIWDWQVMIVQNSPLLKRFVVDIKRRDPFPVLVLGDRAGSWKSKIWARSTAKRGTYLLGRAYDFVNWDEAARDPEGVRILDDILRMRMADREGRIDMTSTGAGKNWYWKQCDLGRKDAPHYLHYYFQTGSSYENPSISKDRLEDAKGRMSEAMVQQNIYGGFVDFANVFPISQIENCYRDQDYSLLTTPAEAQKAIRGFSADAVFAMGVDFARKKDETVAIVTRVDVKPARMVYAQSMGSEVGWDGIYKTIAQVHHTFHDCITVADSTSMGGDISINLLREKYNVTNLIPFNFGGSSGNKTHLITVGQMAIQQKAIVWPYIAQLYDQLGMYDYNDKYLATDWVMAFCLMAEGVRMSNVDVIRIPPPEFMFHTLRRTFEYDTDGRYQHNIYA